MVSQGTPVLIYLATDIAGEHLKAQMLKKEYIYIYVV
jgi:hypothetical protein